MKTLLAITVLSILAFGASANAAIISITSQNSVDSPDYDLTNVYGTSDWAYWENNAAGGGTPLNQKVGANLIGNMSLVGAGTLTGSTSTTRPLHDFVFSDGTNGGESSPKSDVIGLFNNAFNTVGRGVQVNVAAPTADEFTVYLWAAGFEVDIGTLTATVGAASDSDSTLSQGAIRTPGRFYSVLVDPDFAGQLVNLSLTLTSDGTGANSHVSIAAVAVNAPVQAVPEPQSIAVWSLLGVVGLAIGACVWRRK